MKPRILHVLAVGPFQSLEGEFTGFSGHRFLWNFWRSFRGVSGLALDDLDDRFATAVKLALGASRTSGDDESDAGIECPSSDMIASYYEYALNRVERARLEAHFSGCARCQGTLAALLRTAPAVDTASEAGGSAAAAARRAAAESAGIRERWFEIRPAWRIAGVTAVATAMLAVVVVAGVHVYQGRIYQVSTGQEREQVAALSPAPSRHHRPRPHPAPGASSSNALSGAEIALNDKKSANKSLIPAAPAEPRTATAPSAAAGAPGAPSTAPADASGEAGAPAEEVAPPIAPSNPAQNEAAPASAAQAAAALGALAATPAPVAATAPSTSAAPSVAAAPSAAAPSVAAPAAAASVAAAAPPQVAASPATPPASAAAGTVESKDNSAATAAAPAAGAVAAGAVGAGIAAKAAAPPASEMARARQRLPRRAPSAERSAATRQTVTHRTPSLQQFAHAAVTQAPAKASKAAPARELAANRPA